MAWWKVVAAKAAILLAAALAMLGTIALLFVTVLGNGSAVGSDEFSWTNAVVPLCVAGSQGILIVVGCLAAWRWVDDLNESAYASSF